MEETWLTQRRELQQLAKSEGLPIRGKRGKLKNALRFAEMLTLVSNVQAGSRLIREDREGALSFLEVVANLSEAFESAVAQPSTSAMTGPFHELADFVVEFLNEIRVLNPTGFI